MCFCDTQTQSLSQNSRNRQVCHCATQLKLEGVESTKHHCGLWKNCHNDGNCAQWTLTETTEKSHHSSLEAVPLRHWSSQVSEVDKLSNETSKCHTTEILHNDKKLASRFKFVIGLMLPRLRSHRWWFATHSRVFQLSMSSTFNVSVMEVHTRIATIRIDLLQVLRERARQVFTCRYTEHLQTSFLHCLL